MTRIFLGLAMASMLGGCFAFGGASCEKPKAYQDSRLTAPLDVPEGLDELDATKALDVPVASTPPGEGEGCIESPPPYSQRMAEIRDDDED